jgi:predicted phosphate transport protein (TIGR00153 family)
MSTGSIFKVFARSPLAYLQDHMDKVEACAQKLLPFFEAVLAQDWDQVEVHQRAIAFLENQADEIKRDVRAHLPRGIFLPVARTDILELISKQDVIANCAKDIAGIVLGRRMQIPAAIVDAFMVYVARSVDATVQAKRTISELGELQETGFSGSEVDIVKRMIIQLAAIEHETDELQIQIRQSIFSFERESHAVDIMFLYKIVEWVGGIADKAQKVGDRIQLLVAR